MITTKPNRGDLVTESDKFRDAMNNWMEDVTRQLDSIPAANYTATTNPAVTDDAKAGYAVGSDWLNTSSGKWYKCRDAAIGAAVWDLLN